MRLIASIWLIVAAWLMASAQQPVPPAASPAEITAGTDRFKYLTPWAAAQSGLSSPTGGISAAVAVTIADTNIDYKVPSMLQSGTNIINGSRVAYAINSENRWVWYSSDQLNRSMKAFISDDGIRWFQMTTNSYDYRDPDYGTNTAEFGPISTEFCAQYDRTAKRYYGVYNYDPYNTNENAQALGIAQSDDGTNWTRTCLIWPNGITNGGGSTFAATWFTDPPTGSNYLLYGWATGQFGNPKNTYLIRRLDSTYTNWSSPLMTMAANSNAVWDGQLTYNQGRYEIYTYMGGCAVWTNSTLTNAFTFMKEVADADGASEAPYVIKFSENYWRLYSRSYHAIYIETYNAGETWSKVGIDIPHQTKLGWHAPGILAPQNSNWRMPDGGGKLVFASLLGSANVDFATVGDDPAAPYTITNFIADSTVLAGFNYLTNASTLTNLYTGFYQFTFNACVSSDSAEILHFGLKFLGDAGYEETASSVFDNRRSISFVYRKFLNSSRGFKVIAWSDVDTQNITILNASLLVTRLSP